MAACRTNISSSVHNVRGIATLSPITRNSDLVHEELRNSYWGSTEGLGKKGELFKTCHGDHFFGAH